ncbi:hypothetical protein BY996DRAFT_8447504, partial [Phakopsora pachyrhizi]
MTSKSRQMVNRSSTNRDGSGNDLPEGNPNRLLDPTGDRERFVCNCLLWNESEHQQTGGNQGSNQSKLTNKLFQNLQDEINILKKIRHENVVGLLDCIRTNQYIFLIMQYCEDGDLSVYIKTRSKQPSSQALDQGRSGRWWTERVD